MPPSFKGALGRRFWRHSFLARVLLLSLASGAGGFFVGALIGLSNWISAGPFHSWWYWVGFTAPVNGVWMMLLGFPVGLIVFALTAAASSRWSMSRKRRFARGLKTRLFLPLALSLVVTSLAASLFWIAWHRGFSSSAFNFGNVLGTVEMATLAFSSCAFALLLARSSKTKRPRRKTQVLAERVLPLD